jgi:ribosomal protein S18 acetylase RimI-like enzyme
MMVSTVNDNSRDYAIESASWHDLKALSELEKICFADDAWSLLELLGLLAFPGVVRLKAVVKGKMVGFIAGDPRRNETAGWILTLGVVPEWRRQGIAEALLGDCEQKMSLPNIKLTVRRSNAGAIHLYEKMNYRQVDIWSHYYNNGEDGLVMEKKFPSSL